MDVGFEEICRLELRHRVQLIDISQSGALLACEAPLPVGTKGQFRAGFAALPFSAEVTIKRHQVKTPVKGQAALGAQFAAMDERSRSNLDQFLKRGKD